MSTAGKAGLAAIGQAPAKAAQPPRRAAASAPAASAPAAPAASGSSARRPARTQAASAPTAPPAGASNGRAASLARRRAMSTNGKAGLGMARGGAPSVQKLVEAVAGDGVDCSNLSGREICRLRRQALAQGGKGALQAAAAASAPREERKEKKGGCGCGCNGKKMTAEGVCATELGQRDAPLAEAAVEAGLDAVCEIADREDGAEPGPAMSAVRALCMARRQALASRGKSAVNKAKRLAKGPMGGQQAWQAAAAKGLNGRDLARARRAELCAVGRGDAPECRPTGRVRPQGGPVKVEEGTTLSGQRVSGTQVERASRITGSESGTCRAVTGTEYIGAEQYDAYCGTRPAPNAPKVGVRETLRGQGVSGTEVGRSVKVTGDEAGTCRAITGTEYMGADEYAGFCGGRPAPAAPKVGEAATRKGGRISGTTVGRSVKVTGDEPGSCRSITGTEYLNEAASEVPCVGKTEGGPQKVGVMHTLTGRAVSGSAVGRSVKVTGDERGGCKSVTGTEYIGSEEYTELCATRPAPTPAKVARSTTFAGLGVTGAAVGRDVKVTGDEAGSCARLTGSQYYTASDFGGLCETPTGQGPRKVGVMHTLKGRELSGTEVGSSSRVTGDEYGGCKPITGTEYVGSEHYDAFCPSTRPEATPEKVTVSRTFNQQAVSGTAVGRSVKVTGDEYGACKPVTGTAYISREQYQEFCEASAVVQAQERVRAQRSTPAAAITGSQPELVGRVTGAERGACQPLTGAPYVGSDEYAAACASNQQAAAVHPRLQPEYAAPRPAAAPAPEPLRAGGFSVTSPARAAWERRTSGVTGTAYGDSGHITGPVNKAAGLVSGTPEFRYRDERVPHAQAPEAAPAAAPAQAGGRITGNGSEDGVTITGDSWQRGERVTGTEGPFGRRNMTLRGDPRGQGRSASAYKELERPEVPPSKITGSSGNTSGGSLVTLSGGARG
ncbi:carboxysome shell protein [Ectothiorhodospiraceae bacterium 2226]|nr:carboxysome shell protein [Ectothiorhodospiraceae bacterium 2226]